MAEKPTGMEFLHAPYDKRENDEYEPKGELADIFKHGEYVRTEDITNYVQKIVNQVGRQNTNEARRACVLDLLRDKNIKDLIIKTTKKEDLADIEKMVDYWVKRIKDKVIEELQKQLPDADYFFVTDVQPSSHKLNRKSTLTKAGTDEKLFFKEHSIATNNNTIYTSEIRKQIEARYKKIQTAIENLENPEKDMPFVINPKYIGHTTSSDTKDNPPLSTIYDYTDLTSLDQLAVDEKNIRKILNCLLDCTRGAHFLAQQGLSLTDLNTPPLGKNFAINNRNGRGILFDLDGLLDVGKTANYIVVPQDQWGKPNIPAAAPEYRDFFTGHKKTTITAESMIWEIGSTISAICEKMVDYIISNKMAISHKKLLFSQQKIKSFAQKMQSKNPADRPTFENCIIELEKLISSIPDQK